MGAEIIEYEVIANYPHARFNVGDRFRVYKESCVAYVTGTSKEDVRDYPHLFKKVEEEPKQ